MIIKDLDSTQGGSRLRINTWSIEEKQHWAIFAADSHSISMLVDVLAGAVEPDYGKVERRGKVVACVSLSLQQQLLEKEIENEDTDFLDRIDYGSTVAALLEEQGVSRARLARLVTDLDLDKLFHRPFRQLSTGESRRVMLAMALARDPDILVLDEPYSGLDVEHRAQLGNLLHHYAQQIQMVVVTAREEEIPTFVTHVALFDHEKLTETLSYQAWLTHPLLPQLRALSKNRSQAWVELIKDEEPKHYPDPLVVMNDVTVEYVDQSIFKGVNWQIKRGEHWQIRGPNGCGKSTLLGLIMGDHPQCYSNDITVLGMKRGSGESIWQVKEHIGIVSSALHLQYRVNCSALDVLLSGYFDSIGLYQQPSKKQVQAAKQWLKVLEMGELESVGFKSLGYGQQRLLLVARALIKHPALLILDEPYQGLDFLNRKLVFHALNRIAEAGISQILYVTHHKEDRLNAITHFVDFVPEEEGYRVDIR